jgi:ribose 1,5-bisphosphokinase PhnN
VFLAKPILGRRLRKRFRQSLEGLKAALERQQPA